MDSCRTCAGRAAGSSGYSHFRDSISGTGVDSLIIDSAAMDSIALGSAASDSVSTDSAASDSTALEMIPQLTARDTIFAPDSLRETDPLRYRYYVELRDSLTRLSTRDSLRAAGDSLELHRLDSLIFKDSSETAYRDSIAWFNSLSRKERKKYLAELHAGTA